MGNFVMVSLGLVAIKALIIGSDFSFYWLIKDGKKYWKWYCSRETYKENWDL